MTALAQDKTLALVSFKENYGCHCRHHEEIMNNSLNDRKFKVAQRSPSYHNIVMLSTVSRLSVGAGIPRRLPSPNQLLHDLSCTGNALQILTAT